MPILKDSFNQFAREIKNFKYFNYPFVPIPYPNLLNNLPSITNTYIIIHSSIVLGFLLVCLFDSVFLLNG